jgi:hypothetical protein
MSAPTHPTSLLAQQQALVTALFARPSGTAAALALLPQLDSQSAQGARGLQAYQANGHSLAERSLRAAFPVIDMMIGGNSFNALARDLWHQHPPDRGDLALWGEALPAFISTNTQLADVPYLADVARAEWALHRAAFAADAQPDPASFARLTVEDPETLTLNLAPGTCTVASPFPVASLVLAHRQSQPSLEEAAARLRQGQAETALIWRQGMKPCLAACSPTAAVLVAQLLSGANLSSALDVALPDDSTDGDAFDFSQWLTEAVGLGLVTGVGTAESQ